MPLWLDQPQERLWKWHRNGDILRYGRWSGRASDTEPLGGGSPVRSVYFVAEQDPETAKAIIGAMMAPNEKVEAWGRLPEAAVKALGLKPGDFKHD